MARGNADLAAVRAAVRRGLRPYSPGQSNSPDRSDTPGRSGQVVLVACSGGPDSLALAAATAFVAPRMGLRAGLVTVDHGLQEGSAQRADQVADWATGSGFAPVIIERATVAGRPGGPEAAARDGRYAALADAAARAGASLILLGHTRDDQAETVLLALLRGAGGRGLAGMPAARTDPTTGLTMLRPLLDISRTQTNAAAVAAGLTPWSDPHNQDPAFSRTHARALLGELAARLGAGVVANLARTAQLAAADVAVIDELARSARREATDADGALVVASLVALPEAVRRAVLRAWVREQGVPGSALGYRHLASVDALLVDWHGQRGASLPGGFVAVRRDGRLLLSR